MNDKLLELGKGGFETESSSQNEHATAGLL